MNYRQQLSERQSNRKVCNKAWYLVLAFFLLWPLLLYSYFPSSKDKSNSVSTEKQISAAEIDRISIANNFFIGGDWEKYLDNAQIFEVPENPAISGEAQKQEAEPQTDSNPSSDAVNKTDDSAPSDGKTEIKDANATATVTVPDEGQKQESNPNLDSKTTTGDSAVVDKNIEKEVELDLKKDNATIEIMASDKGNKEESKPRIDAPDPDSVTTIGDSAQVDKKIVKDAKLNLEKTTNDSGTVTDDSVTVDKETEKDEKSNSDSDPCSGRYIYVRNDLPADFNVGMIEHCRSLSQWTDMCLFLSNSGLGPVHENNGRVLSKAGWFETNQFTLEFIFHNRLKQYECLTSDSSLASAIFVPYYAGLDVARFLWHKHRRLRDHYPLTLVRWLREKPEWQRMWGRDHFLVAGRITWDFRRSNNGKDWGNQLMLLPESKNMTILTIEKSPWNQNDFAIPYPTYFHPSSDNQVFDWQNRMRRMRRTVLFSFAGSPRPDLENSIRGEIINQCVNSKGRCQLLECALSKCYKPDNVMRLFESSVFCLQPSGDSFTRRSTFDSMLAGCIPVFFHPGSAYVQYVWHLPKNYSDYSVLIPEDEIKYKNASIETILGRISQQRILAMRERVIRLIPNLVYADPRNKLETLKDAFDTTIDAVLKRVDNIKKDIKKGKIFWDDSEKSAWKVNLFGTSDQHEWDHYFF